MKVIPQHLYDSQNIEKNTKRTIFVLGIIKNIILEVLRMNKNQTRKKNKGGARGPLLAPLLLE